VPRWRQQRQGESNGDQHDPHAGPPFGLDPLVRARTAPLTRSGHRTRGAA
jgi:hypothetical protein